MKLKIRCVLCNRIFRHPKIGKLACSQCRAEYQKMYHTFYNEQNKQKLLEQAKVYNKKHYKQNKERYRKIYQLSKFLKGGDENGIVRE